MAKQRSPGVASHFLVACAALCRPVCRRRLLIETLRRKFLEAGGELLEETAFKSAAVLDDGVHVELLPGRQAAPGMQPGDVNRPMAMAAASAAAGRPGTGSSSSSSSSSGGHLPHSPRRSITARLLVDCMGHYSPIAKQLRGGQRPDGVVLVVGGAWLGFSPERNTAADLLHTFTDSADDQQLFWEAFPAAGGQARTLYMFQYSDAHPSRPSFTQLLDTYLHLLPQYQGVPLEQLQPQRILMGEHLLGGWCAPERGSGWEMQQLMCVVGRSLPRPAAAAGTSCLHMPSVACHAPAFPLVVPACFDKGARSWVHRTKAYLTSSLQLFTQCSHLHLLTRHPCRRLPLL
jgi:hypothetical protein